MKLLQKCKNRSNTLSIYAIIPFPPKVAPNATFFVYSKSNIISLISIVEKFFFTFY